MILNKNNKQYIMIINNNISYKNKTIKLNIIKSKQIMNN